LRGKAAHEVVDTLEEFAPQNGVRPTEGFTQVIREFGHAFSLPQSTDLLKY
jgi:hypothetical protein